MPRFGSRSSPPLRTLSTQLSTFSGTLERKGRREADGMMRWVGYGGRQAASEKCPRSVTTLRLFFSSSAPSGTPRARAVHTGWRWREDSERMGHTCAAHSLFSSFLPSFLFSFLSCRCVTPSTLGPAAFVVDFLTRYWRVRQSRTLPQNPPWNRDLHLSWRRACTTCRGHLALYSFIATGNSKIACLHGGSY